MSFSYCVGGSAGRVDGGRFAFRKPLIDQLEGIDAFRI